MSIIHMPDPHPGRCPNLQANPHDPYGSLNRCTQYADVEHVCKFTHLGPAHVAAAMATQTTYTSPPTPTPWVSPEDAAKQAREVPGA